MDTSRLMPIENLPDWEMRVRRQDAFWSRAILDRPVCVLSYARHPVAQPWPESRNWRTRRERWLDAEYVADSAVARTANTVYAGDALPTAWPNLGPEWFSALYGCAMEFGETTAWSEPNLHDWRDAGRLALSTDNVWWRAMLEMTDLLLAKGRGLFYTGFTDLHGGGDCVAAFRDPQNLCVDMLEARGQVVALLDRLLSDYLQTYDFWQGKLAAAGQATTAWPGIVSSLKWCVPSNDFSCMISKTMFDEVFLPGIAAECRHMEANIYHLDGPDALRHLDSLLSIPELNAIQWVYGAGHGRASDWLPVYQRCQAAGKGLQIGIGLDELDTMMTHLHPEGIWLSVGGVHNASEAEAVLKTVARWR